MLVVSSRMVGVSIAIVIPKDIPAVLIPRMVGVTDSPCLPPVAHGPNLEVFGHIDHHALVTKDIPGNQASLRGLFEPKFVVHYEWVIIHHSPYDEEIVSQIVPTVLVGHSLAHATFHRQSSI